MVDFAGWQVTPPKKISHHQSIKKCIPVIKSQLISACD